jgi:hypothetical protein
MKKSIHGGAFVSAVLFLVCVVLLLVYVEFLPLWMTDPYTYSAYKQSKQIQQNLQDALEMHTKMMGMTSEFSEIATIYDMDKKQDKHLYSFEPLIKKGIQVGSIENETKRFNENDLAGDKIELRWKNRDVIANYEMSGNKVKGRVYAIFNLGKIIDENLDQQTSL